MHYAILYLDSKCKLKVVLTLHQLLIWFEIIWLHFYFQQSEGCWLCKVGPFLLEERMETIQDYGLVQQGDKIVVSSRKIAEVFEKRHSDVLDALKNINCSKEFAQRNFTLGSYLDSNNQERPEYLITRDGFTFLVMGFTGEKAAKFKEGYIVAFNIMEDKLRKCTPIQSTEVQLANAYLLALKVIEENNKQLQLMAPKAEYFDELVDRKLLTNFRNTAKEYGIKQDEFITYLIDHNYIYRDSSGKMFPKSEYTPSLFEIKEWKNGGKAGLQTLINPKGRETFRILIAKHKANKEIQEEGEDNE
jgi:Rha family phage regulatory protein